MSTAFEFYSTYKNALKRINDNLDQIEQTQVKTLATNAWVINNEGIQVQLHSLVQHPDIVYLEFTDNNSKTKIYAGTKPESFADIIAREIPISFMDGGKDVTLGVFTLMVSVEPTKEILYQQIPRILLFESIKVITLCGLVIWIIYHLFSRPLSKIANYTNTLDIDKLHNRLTLQRKTNCSEQTDELSQIVKAVNELQDRIKKGLMQKEEIEAALRKNEELLQFATEGASLGIWDWNIITNKTYFNPIYFTMLGYEADEFPHSYNTWNYLMHPDDRDKVAAEVNQCMLQDQPWRVEFRMRTKTEGYKWILGSGKVVEKNESGRPLRASGIHMDISQSKNLEEERQKVVKLESVGVLAGGIAHDFNNILTAILGNIELACHRLEKDAETAAILVNAQKATKRAAKLTQQLLTFSKGGEPVKETTSLAQLVRESADFVLHGSQVFCEYDFPDDFWLVDVDGGQIGQVIQNITLNAINAMPEGGGLKIVCRNVDESAAKKILNTSEGNFVSISIRDTGVGISSESMDKIFDPYYTTRHEGNGLGLAICHSIISKHNGHIAVQSVPGEGTTFTIYLPAVTTSASFTVEKKRGGALVKSAKIMVMDDDEMVRNVARAQLSILGHEAILVKDGRQALDDFMDLKDRNITVDLVIMDLTIPGGMGGKETARELLTIAPEVKIIVASGYSVDPVMANYRDYGFCAAIAKPFNLDELRGCIESVLA